MSSFCLKYTLVFMAWMVVFGGSMCKELEPKEICGRRKDRIYRFNEVMDEMVNNLYFIYRKSFIFQLKICTPKKVRVMLTEERGADYGKGTKGFVMLFEKSFIELRAMTDDMYDTPISVTLTQVEFPCETFTPVWVDWSTNNLNLGLGDKINVDNSLLTIPNLTSMEFVRYLQIRGFIYSESRILIPCQYFIKTSAYLKIEERPMTDCHVESCMFLCFSNSKCNAFDHRIYSTPINFEPADKSVPFYSNPIPSNNPNLMNVTNIRDVTKRGISTLNKQNDMTKCWCLLHEFKHSLKVEYLMRFGSKIENNSVLIGSAKFKSVFKNDFDGLYFKEGF